MAENDNQKPMVDPTRAAMAASYPANSKKSKEEPKKDAAPREKLVPLEGIEVKVQKPSLGRRIRTAFTGDDARGIGDYLLFEVALPAIKTTIYDLITGGANRALFGQGLPPGSANRRPGVVNYNQVSNKVQQPAIQANMSATDRAQHNFDNIIFSTRQDAERALRRLIEIVDSYDVVAVSDLYEIVNVTGSFVDDKWGWFNLAGADIVAVRGGFIIDFPNTQQIR
jgi:hypothetical protein